MFFFVKISSHDKISIRRSFKPIFKIPGDRILPQSSGESWIPVDNEDTADAHVYAGELAAVLPDETRGRQEGSDTIVLVRHIEII